MKHATSFEFGGQREMGWMMPVCSCGWSGRKYYAYEDYQHTMAREEGYRHAHREKQGGDTCS